MYIIGQNAVMLHQKNEHQWVRSDNLVEQVFFQVTMPVKHTYMIHYLANKVLLKRGSKPLMLQRIVILSSVYDAYSYLSEDLSSTRYGVCLWVSPLKTTQAVCHQCTVMFSECCLRIVNYMTWWQWCLLCVAGCMLDVSSLD